MAEIIQRELFDENGEVVGYEYRGRLVRCKNCKHHKDEEVGMVYCPNIVGGWVQDEDFCSWGETNG